MPARAATGAAAGYFEGMDDMEVIEAFIKTGSRNAFGPLVHVERDVLLLSGWWHTAVRVTPEVFIVRNEEPPFECTVLPDLAGQLAAHGLQQVGIDLPAIQIIAYAELSLGGSSWALWAPDLATGEETLAARATEESFLSDMTSTEPVSADFSAELGGARRVAGLRPSLILAVGVGAEAASRLENAFPNCNLETTTLAETSPSVCGTLIPSLVLVDATERAGEEFIMELRVEACGRFLPVVAVSRSAEVPLGADIALDPDADPATWVAPIQALLP